MWKNRGVNQSTEKLLSIAGIAAISLAMGWSDETKVDNLGQYIRPPVLAYGDGSKGRDGREVKHPPFCGLGGGGGGGGGGGRGPSPFDCESIAGALYYVPLHGWRVQ